MLGTHRTAVPTHRIGEGAQVAGTVRFSGRLEIDGTVAGSVISEGDGASEVVVGPKGRVEGDISATTVAISGTVQGPVRATLRLDVLAGARLVGDVTYRDLQIQHGALVEGSLKPIEGEQVALKLVANSRI